MKGKDRAALRAEAHHLQPTVHIGHQGVTDSVIGAMDDALRTRELVKADISRNAPESVRDTANALAAATSADVIQVIGRKATLFRENTELDHGKDLPPWR